MISCPKKNYSYNEIFEQALIPNVWLESRILELKRVIYYIRFFITFSY